MLPVVELPEIVRHYAPWFEEVFSPEAWLQFQRYVSGLMVSENKTVEGINRLVVHENRHQSSPYGPKTTSTRETHPDHPRIILHTGTNCVSLKV